VVTRCYKSNTWRRFGLATAKRVALSSRQKPRFLPAETKPLSEKAPQATFSH
jgi:hypothetical protein